MCTSPCNVRWHGEGPRVTMARGSFCIITHKPFPRRHMLLKEVLGLQDACFFPGGNTPQGFVCRFEDIMPPERARRVYFIKGGSGVGKSTFMRAVGEHCARAGRRVEYFRCSSDPDSLDGVSVPELGVALMDGTAPHAMDPRLPGVRDFTLDLGRFLSEARLAGAREELERAMARRAACFARAYARLSAAQALYCDAGRALSVALRPGEELIRELERALGPAAHGEGRGGLRRLFADAVTPSGLVSVLDTLPARRRVRVELPWGCDASPALEAMARRAQRRGEDAVLLMDPLMPERALHLYLPERGALVCADGGLVERDMAFDAAVPGAAGGPGDAEALAAAEFDRRECMGMIGAAVEQLALARRLHARVEERYSSAMDFERVQSLREEVCAQIDALSPQN